MKFAPGGLIHYSLEILRCVLRTQVFKYADESILSFNGYMTQDTN